MIVNELLVEANKIAGLTLPLNEAKSLDRLRKIAENIQAMQRLFSDDSSLVKSIKADQADVSYVKDIVKLLNDLDEAVTELQKSVDHMDQNG